MSLKLTLAIFLALIVITLCFESQFLGNYLSDEEYAKREFCNTKVCLLDNDRLIYAATRNASIHPCDDFREFAMGEFLKHRVLNDRYQYIGFQFEIQNLFKERQRIILNKRDGENDSKTDKVLKSFFKKCTNSDLVRRRGTQDMIAFLQQLGGSPLVTNDTWSDENFDIKTLFEEEPLHATLVFLDHKLTRCKNPKNETENDVLCFNMDNGWRVAKNVMNDTIDILEPFKLSESAKARAVKDFIDFLSLKNVHQKKFKDNAKPEVFKISEFNSKFSQLNLDWLKIINSQLLGKSKLTEEDEIVIENPELFQHLLTLIATLEKRTIANIFATTFIYKNKQSFIVYSFNRRDAYLRGTKQDRQRFEQCIYTIEGLMRSAMEALSAKKYYDEDTKRATTELINEAVADVVNKIKVAKELKNNEDAREKIIKKLKTMKLSVMFPDEILDQKKIEEMYDELNIDGSESLVDMTNAMFKHFRKLFVETNSNWMKRVEKFTQEFPITYFLDENTLNVPVLYTLFPYYHQNRSRFFNMATFYKPTVQALQRGVYKFLKKEINKTFCCMIDNAILADKNYLDWEANGGKELQLSAFKMTNRQMLWLASANRYTSKYHFSVPKSFDPLPRLQNDYLHVRYKNKKSFRSAFKCGNMTDIEKANFKEFQMKDKMFRGY